MPSRSHSRKTSALALKTAELAFAAPQVIAHRTARMALAGPVLSARDRKEFEGMVAEKGTAFVQSWQAMWLQSLLAQQTMALSLMRAAWSPAGWGTAAAAALAGQAQAAALGIASGGLAPVHRKAVANARRLGRARRRL